MEHPASGLEQGPELAARCALLFHAQHLGRNASATRVEQEDRLVGSFVGAGAGDQRYDRSAQGTAPHVEPEALTGLGASVAHEGLEPAAAGEGADVLALDLGADDVPGSAVGEADDPVPVHHDGSVRVPGGQLAEDEPATTALAQRRLQVLAAAALLLQATVLFFEQAVLQAEVVLERLDPQHGPHHVLHQGQVTLDQEGLAAGLVAAVKLLLALHLAADEDHRHAVELGHGLEAATDLEAVDALAQADVDEEQVEALLASGHDAVGPRGGDGDFVSQITEPVLEEVLSAGLVFDQENATHGEVLTFRTGGGLRPL